MFILKIRYSKSHVTNEYSADHYNILARMVTIVRKGYDNIDKRLDSGDLVFVMNAETGDTINRFQAPVDPDSPEDV